MDFGLRGRTCLVTGASSGIGHATALVLAAEGARVVAAARSVAAMDALQAAIQAIGGIAAVTMAADLAAPGGADGLAAEALAQVGSIDVLINNAGGSRLMTEPDDPAVWDEAFQLNFVASRRLAECLIPIMVERGWGRVVSVTGAVAGKTINAATPAKAALESWSKGAAGQYAARGESAHGCALVRRRNVCACDARTASRLARASSAVGSGSLSPNCFGD